MKSFLTFKSFACSSFSVVAFCALTSFASAVNISTLLGKSVVTHGTGTSTVTQVTENPDGTLGLQAEQEGSLIHLGKFTGEFAYLATIDYNTGTTVITGNGIFDFKKGDKLFLSANIVEVGLDYPRPYNGALTVTGGTGKYADASGLLEISGVDEESPTDGLVLNGVIVTGQKKTHDLALDL